MQNKTRISITFCRSIALLAILAGTALAQTERAGISGVVRDHQGQAIPGAVVEVRHKTTMGVRKAVTGNSGTYFIDGLSLGDYSMRINRPGFAEALSENIRLFVGETRTVDVTLEIIGSEEHVVITANSSEVDQTSAAVGGRVEQAQITELPLNGRNWASLLRLIPGAVDTGASDQRSIRFAGHGRDDNNFTLDGVDAGGISNQPQKSGIRIAIPTSTLAEFKADSSLFTAESGNATGGQVTLASIGGTNTIHGAAFDFFRNDIFDARNPFAQTKPPFHLNQFGATFGGPLARNETFMFLAFEGLRQRLGQTIRGFVPSAQYRAQMKGMDPALQPLIDAFSSVGTQGQLNDPTTDSFAGLSSQRADENSGMVRFDHRLTANTSAFLRLNVDRAVNNVPLGNLKDRQVTDNRLRNSVLSIMHVFSATALNETRFGFNQAISRTFNQTPLPFSLAVAGFTTISSSRTREEDDTSFSFIDHLSVVRGRHAIKLGVDVRRVLTDPGSSADATLTYASRDAFLLNQLDSASGTSALPLKRLRKTQLFAFMQDEFKLRPSFTMSLGVRYQFFNVFHEANARAVPFDFASCGGFCQPGAMFSEPRKGDVDPRIGLAWAPARFHGKTVIRSGFGVYHSDGQLEDQNLPASNDVPRYSLSTKQIPSLRYPIDPFLVGAQGILSPRAQDRRRKDENSSQWSVSIQQQLPVRFTGTATYTGNKGTHLQTITYQNVADPLTGLRPYPQYGQVEYRTNESNSTFHALQLSTSRTMHAGWLMSANYMWSHAINDGSLGGGEADAVAPQNVFCRACEKASSTQDIRHVFTAASVYELPFGRGRQPETRLLRILFGKWSVSGIASGRTGKPVNVTIKRSASDVPGGYNLSQRPDVVPGVSLIPAAGQTPLQWINPAAFRPPARGTWGNAGRNLIRGPGISQLDISLSKRFSVGEHVALDFRTEIFNAFNRAQYADPLGDATVPTQLGVIQSTVNTTPIGTGTPRELQFMLRVSF